MTLLFNNCGNLLILLSNKGIGSLHASMSVTAISHGRDYNILYTADVNANKLDFCIHLGGEFQVNQTKVSDPCMLRCLLRQSRMAEIIILYTADVNANKLVFCIHLGGEFQVNQTKVSILACFAAWT